jgi:Cytochrome bd-type quinol oxidase, subunit 1
MKFAATEGIYEDTKDPAPWTVVEMIDAKDHKASGQVDIPGVLSTFGLSQTKWFC